MEDNWKGFKDPLNMNVKETTDNLVRGAFTFFVGVPLFLGLSKLIGGDYD